MPRTSRLTLAFALLPLLWACAAETGLRGAWHTETYFLQDGTRHRVEGLIFFTESDWTVAATEPCELELDGDRLTLRFPSGNSMTFLRSSDF